MSRNFHTLHVRVRTDKQQERVLRAIVAYAKKTGFEQVPRANGADRVIRIGGKPPWLTIEDDGYQASAIAEAVSKATKLPILEASCEASAIVSLVLHARGEQAGEWTSEGDGPPADLVDPLLVKGDAAELESAFADGIAQIFPETALAVAAERFGLKTECVFGQATPRGTTVALRRKKGAWTPAYRVGKVALTAGFGGSNRGWGPRHLLFEGNPDTQRLQVTSTGGKGRGLSFQFAGSAIEEGHIEILSCKSDGLALVAAGPNRWQDANAQVPAGLVEGPDLSSMGEREWDKARAITDQLELYVDLQYRAVAQGECDWVVEVASGDVQSIGSLGLMVMKKPWRPSVAQSNIEDHRLFSMHRCELSCAHVTLRGSLAEAWAWARPHIEAWSSERGDDKLRVERDQQTMRIERGDDSPPPFARVERLIPNATTSFQVAGRTYLFGTFAYAPHALEPGDQLAVQLVLCAPNPEGDGTANLARLEALCDDAIRSGAAISALIEHNNYAPSDKTFWEAITVTSDDPLNLASWHESHIRGIDKRIWLSEAHAARLDRSSLPSYFMVTELGRGLRLQTADDQPRRDLEPMIRALGSMVPTEAERQRWKEARGRS